MGISVMFLDGDSKNFLLNSCIDEKKVKDIVIYNERIKIFFTNKQIIIPMTSIKYYEKLFGE